MGMRILIITPSVYPYEIGGAQMHSYYIAKGLTRNQRVKIVSIGKEKLEETLDGVQYHLITIIKKAPLPTIMFIVKSFPIIVKYKPKIILVDLISSETFIAPLLKLIFKIPYIATAHGSEIRRYKKRTKLFRTFDEKMKSMVIKKANFVVAVSKEIADILTRDWAIPKERVCVIGNGFDSEKICNAKTDSVERKSTNRLVYVGRLVPEKDLFTLLRAMTSLSNLGNNASLDIIGDGPCFKELNQFCVESGILNVNFLGCLSHEKVLEAISNSDIFVLSSIEEGLPIVIIEAMSLGKPVIATSVGGIPELIVSGFNGYLVPPKSIESLVNAIELILNDSVLYETLSKNALKSVEPLLWSKISEKYEEILYSLISKKTS